MLKIFFINCVGAGFADRIEVADGTTVGQLFGQKMPDCKPGDYLIRVDRQAVASDEPLRDGCRVSITPTKIEGAR